MTHFGRGPVTAMAIGGGMSAHLADIEKLSNGFIVRFQKAQKIPVKKKDMNSLGFDAETKDLIKFGLQKMKEGDQWKDVPPEAAELLNSDAPLEKWITVPMAVACRDEVELLAAIRDAVIAHGEIDRLALAGEFGGGFA